jgi:hypothetical protein
VLVPLERAHLLVWLPARLFRRILTLRSPLRHWKSDCGIPDSVTLANRNETGFWPLRWRVWRFLR